MAQADNEGRFTLNAPGGDQNLVVRGDRVQAATGNGPAPTEHTVDVALEPDVFKLEEIVITGQATGVEQPESAERGRDGQRGAS